MSRVIYNFCKAIVSVTYILEGDLGYSNKEIIEMRRQVLYGKIPSMSTDRENLKNDSRHISKDLNKSLDECKKSHRLATAD